MRQNKQLLSLLIACLMVCLLLSQAAAAEKKPLLQEGKKSLFQRVVTHPGAILHQAPQENGVGNDKTVKTFSVYYVYDKKDGYLEVGPSSNASIGWIKESNTTYWPQAMTLLFTERGTRAPVLFFANKDVIKEICASDNIGQRVSTLLEGVKKSQSGQSVAEPLPVVAAEPSDEQGAVARNHFYLMPIQQYDNEYGVMKLLQVASIDPGKKQAPASSQADASQNGKPKVSIAFVIDTTISMRPYIEQMRNVIKMAFDEIEQNKLGDSVEFAIVAYRNSTHMPGVEYTAKVIHDFASVKERKALENALATVDEARASTHSYNEDAMAGIKEAADSLKWGDKTARVMVLITDAGPLAYGDQHAATPMGPKEIRDYVTSGGKNIQMFVMHVKNPSGKANHQYAQDAYKQSATSNSATQYYTSIDASTPEKGSKSFYSAAKGLTSTLVTVIQGTSSLEKPKEMPPQSNPEDEAKRLAAILGYALKLDFIGTARNNAAPEVVSSWITDMDLEKLGQGHQVPNVEVAVLLTKNQLSDLQNSLKLIVDNAEKSKRTDSRDFFNTIISAAALAGADPQRLNKAPDANLAQTGVLGEFLDGLPYKSTIMTLTEDQWYRYSVGQQQDFIYKIKALIRRYEEVDKNDANWESFGAEFAGDMVYRMPLSMLP